MNGRIDFSGNRYFGSQEHRDDVKRLATDLVDAARGTNGIVAHDVIEQAVRLDGSEMVNDVVLQARWLVRVEGDAMLMVTLNALVATACATVGVTR